MVLGPALDGEDGVGGPLGALVDGNGFVGGGHVDLLGQIHAVWNVGQAIAIGDDDATVGGDAGDPEETEVDDADVERGADAASELKRVVAAGLAAQRSGGGGGRDGVALGPCG